MRRAAAALAAAIVLAPGLVWPQDLPESSPQALMHHAQGVEAYVHDRYRDAIAHFEQAYAADPTFYVALLMAAVSAGNAGLGTRAESLLALVVPHKDRLSPYYQARLEATLASRAPDLAAYVAANRRAAAVGAGTKASYNVAQGVIQLGRANEARAALRQLDPDREPMKGWISYYSVYAGAAHLIGDYEDELQMARRARRAFPGNVIAAALEAQALAALGRTADAERVLTELQSMPSVPGVGGAVTPGGVTIGVALEFGAHGDAAAATRWLEAAFKWVDALPADQAKSTDSRSDKANALLALGRYREAAPLVDELAAELREQPVWQARQGYFAALAGDKAKAMAVSKRIESNEIRLGRTNGALWRGLIAAAMDDADGALTLIQQSGVRGRWMHSDPVLRRVLGEKPAWVAYLKPVD